tara:strand:+ start:2060 stop:4336 length:2277 start_codon:yes stop_codon:yes gene_type:complete
MDGNSIERQQKLLQIEKEKQALVDKLIKNKAKLTSADKKLLASEEKRLATVKKKLGVENAYINSQTSYFREYIKRNTAIQKQLDGQKQSANVLSHVNEQIAKEKGRQSRYAQATTDYAKEQKYIVSERLTILQAVDKNLLGQAKAVADAQDSLLGTTQIQKDLRDLESKKHLLTKAQYKLAKDTIKQTDALRQKEKRLVEIKQEQSKLFNALPDSIQSMVGGAKKFGGALTGALAPMVLISAIGLAVLSSFTKLDEAAESFRNETGMTNSQMGELKSDANDLVGSFSNLGVEAKDVFDSVSALRSEFSDIVKPSKEVVSSMVVLSKNFGVSVATGAKVQGIFEQIGGLSSETAASVQMQVVQMAKLAGVAPAKIMEDIAENAEIASTLFKGDVESLTQAAIEARRLGTNLKSVATTTEHLLDFQGNIGDELVAATFVGGQFNLTQARSLAAAGKTVEAQKEVLKQLERGGKFRDKDYFTQTQLAKAAGMSVEEINKQLNAQEKLSSLNEKQRAVADQAIKQGLDISNISKEDLANQVQSFATQQEMQGNLTQMKNTFTAIAASVGSVFLPILQSVADVMSFLTSNAEALKVFFGTLALIMGVIYANKLKTYAISKKEVILQAIQNRKSMVGAVSSIFQGQGKLPIVGAVIAAAMVAGLFAAISKGKAKSVGDLSINPNGGPVVMSPREGGLFQGTANDALTMAPPGAMGGGGMTANQVERLIKGVEKQRETYLDGRRVTSNIGRAVEKSTMNNFAIGT